MYANKDDVVQYSIFFLTAVLILTPVGMIFVQSLLDRPIYEVSRTLTLQNYVNMLTDKNFYVAFKNSLIFSAITTVIAVFIGALLAIFTVRTNMPYRHYLSNLVILNMFISPLVGALGWVMMFGPYGWFSFQVKKLIGFIPWNIYSILGMGFIAGLNFVPYAYLSCSSSLTQMDPNLEDTARIAGAGTLRTFITVTLPLLMPAMLYSGIIIFVIGLELLGLPLILGHPYGINVIMTFIYKLGLVGGGGGGKYPYIGAMSVILIIITTTLLFLQRWFIGSERRFVTVSGRAVRPRVVDLGRFRYPVFVGFVLYILLGVILPILGVALRSITDIWDPNANLLERLTIANFGEIFRHPVFSRSILNTLIIALMGASIGTFLVGVITFIVYRSEFPARRLLGYISLYPRAVPAMIMGIGFLWIFVLFKPLAIIRNTIFALVIAFITRRIPYGIINISPTVMQITEEFDKSSRICGATWLQTLRKILFPLIKPGLIGAWILLFAAMVREYSTALFIFTRGTEVIGVTMLEFWRQGEVGPVCALGVIQVIVVFMSLIILHKIVKA